MASSISALDVLYMLEDEDFAYFYTMEPHTISKMCNQISIELQFLKEGFNPLHT